MTPAFQGAFDLGVISSPIGFSALPGTFDVSTDNVPSRLSGLSVKTLSALSAPN
jgi:hypothetical protein